MSRSTLLLMGLLLSLLNACKVQEKSPAEHQFGSPIRMLMIKHPVADYPIWKEAYLSKDSMRIANGLISRNFGRGLDDTSMVVVYTIITDLTKARSFSQSALLQEVMAKAGVIDTATFVFGDVLRRDTSELSIQDRVLVSYRVKDVNAWLRSLDEQGTDTRKENGLIDRGILRDIDDPQMVHVAMAVSDIPKARAWLTSDAYKSFALQAGVESVPDLFFYRREKK